MKVKARFVFAIVYGSQLVAELAWLSEIKSSLRFTSVEYLLEISWRARLKYNWQNFNEQMLRFGNKVTVRIIPVVARDSANYSLRYGIFF